jgi:hypothetical protein
MLKGEIAHEMMDGQEHWFATDENAAKGKAPKAHLLSNYDEYTISAKDRSAIVDPAHAHRLNMADNRLFPHMIVMDGIILGLWRRTFEKDSATVTTQLFRKLTAPEQRALDRATHEYGKFLGVPVTLQ